MAVAVALVAVIAAMVAISVVVMVPTSTAVMLAKSVVVMAAIAAMNNNLFSLKMALRNSCVLYKDASYTSQNKENNHI